MTPAQRSAAYDANGYRETAVATEYRRPDGSTVQACGKGPDVRRMLGEVVRREMEGREP
jgi:hypothetical protein